MFIIYIVIINIISFIMYWVDKKKAIKHHYRIPENILLLISFIGGCFGSIFSMFLFHHKTKHLKFMLINPLLCLGWLIIICKEYSIL